MNRAFLLLALAGVAGVVNASTPAQVPHGPAVPIEVQTAASQIRAQAETLGQDVAQALAQAQPEMQALAVAGAASLNNRRMLSTPAQVPNGAAVPLEVQAAAAQVRAQAQASGQDVSQALAQAQPEIQAAAQTQAVAESGAAPADSVTTSDSGPDSWQNGGWHAGGWTGGSWGSWNSGRNWDRWGRWGGWNQLQNTEEASADATVAAAATTP